LVPEGESGVADSSKLRRLNNARFASERRYQSLSQEKHDVSRKEKYPYKTTLFSDLVPVKKRISMLSEVNFGLAAQARTGIVKTSLTAADAERATVVEDGASKRGRRRNFEHK
jgi:hypothetical protein